MCVAGPLQRGPSISGGAGPLGVSGWADGSNLVETLDESHVLSDLSSPLIKTRSSDFLPDGQTFPEQFYFNLTQRQGDSLS